MKRYVALLTIILLAACNSGDKPAGHGTDEPVQPAKITVPVTNIRVLNVFPHDVTSFTEGLQVHKGKLYEGAGDFTNSALQIAEITTGNVLQKHAMGSATIFGEGINVFKGKIYQLTWKNHVVYVYDEKDINTVIKTFNWPYEGWGMTNDGTNLIISDGKHDGTLYFVSADSFKIVKTITVMSDNGPVENINELEYINGFIYANVWMTDNIIKIDPTTGKVVAVFNCANLLQQYATKEFNDPNFDHEGNVLNGIAYDSATKKTYITGKRWPKLFEVSF